MKAHCSFFGRFFAAVCFGTSFAVSQAGMANADEIKVFTARAIATVLEKVGPEFERTSGHKLNVVSGFGPVFVRQIKAGEPFDLFVSTPPTMAPLFGDGTLLANSRTRLVRSGVGVQVRAGAPKPDISSVEAFKQALLNAKSVGYLSVGGVVQLIERLGLTEALKSKTTLPTTDIVSELVAKGEIELGIVVITQILTTPGVELVGPLPPEIQYYTEFVGGISAQSKAPDAARDLIKFLAGPTAVPVIKSQGMVPG
jgi:molybdate transport system substrate-binding protein